MKLIDDPVVGSIKYERFFWEREETIQLFGREYFIRVRFRGDEDAPLKELQRLAYAGFDSHRDELLKKTEMAVYSYYQENNLEYREMLGDDADRSAPIVSNTTDLADIVTPTHLMVPRTTRSGERVVGLLCDCTWEPGVGLGVKIVNEAIAEIGSQDIVL